MVTLYFSLKLLYILVMATFWLMVGTVAFMVALGYVAFIAIWWTIKVIIWVTMFIVAVVQTIREERQARAA